MDNKIAASTHRGREGGLATESISDAKHLRLSYVSDRNSGIKSVTGLPATSSSRAWFFTSELGDRNLVLSFTGVLEERAGLS